MSDLIEKLTELAETQSAYFHLDNPKARPGWSHFKGATDMLDLVKDVLVAAEAEADWRTPDLRKSLADLRAKLEAK